MDLAEPARRGILVAITIEGQDGRLEWDVKLQCRGKRSFLISVFELGLEKESNPLASVV